ncbi:MAG: ImmA/IrrE family metallo-endopeptidase [Propionibacteriales bacterium]|nr:ImmA/IrrE family metallo-endopeptidase [Propionibacteriales bacterium]
MISWSEAHVRAAAAASELQADLHLDLTRPVDVFDAVQRLGLVLAFAPLGRVSGLYLPEKPTPGILLHSGHPRTRQRYTAGHELGHHVFGHAAEADVDLEGALQRGNVDRWPDHEKEAEAFGAWFLMPRRLIREGLHELGIGPKPADPLDVYALSLWLGTSYTATARQLAAVRLVAYDVADRWAKVQPRTVKQSLAGAMVPDDLRNDVWWLDARHHRQPIDARPGDRLVITLDEIPAAGYTWRVAELPDEVRLLADSYVDAWEPELAAQATEDTDLVGGAQPRSLALEIDRDAQMGIHRLALTKDQPWRLGSTIDEFELLLSVNPPLHGIQVPEDEMALTA